jgi:N-acylneuraminate cytidylyltransferase
MASLAIIPARGGSKRIPKKNIKHFLGKPIIAYSIEAALKSDLFSEVMVSTDDAEIAEIAKKYGAVVPFLRSQKNADDFATTFEVIEEVLDAYKKQGQSFEKACCIYPTAPFVNRQKLIKSFELLEAFKFDCVFPVLRYGTPIKRALKMLDKSGKMEMFNPAFLNTRSQDLEAAFHDAGQFYTFFVEQLLEKKKLWTDHTGIMEITEMEGQDIDNEMDWKLAELKYKLLHEEKNSL